MSREVVINRCHGGFSVSEAVYDKLGVEWDGYGYLNEYADERGLSTRDVEFRALPELVEAIKTVGLEEASGRLADLEIVEIPDDARNPRIDDYDGVESVEEGRRWP